MKIVIATDSFKGSQSAQDVARNIEIGIRRVVPGAEVTSLPIADGGEGTLHAMVYAAGGQIRTKHVADPLGNLIEADYALLGKGVAVIEMATASGLPLVPLHKRNPLKTTSLGTGQLIKAALDEGCEKIIVGVGGSATNDGGMGMAQALGVSFTDANGKELGYGGGELNRLHQVDISELDARLASTEVVIACDVNNPLFGENGASRIYGPQKGADQRTVETLDQNLRHYAQVIRTQLSTDVASLTGGGAGGGIVAGLVVFCGGVIKSGVDVILDAVDFESHITNADLLITGEGKIDGQSIFGKVPVGVGKRAKAVKEIPVIAIVGDVGPGAEKAQEYGIDFIVSTVNKITTLEQAMLNSAVLLQEASERLFRLMALGSRLNVF